MVDRRPVPGRLHPGRLGGRHAATVTFARIATAALATTLLASCNDQLEIEVVVAGAGAVVAESVTCDSTCRLRLQSGSRLRAVPFAGSRFVRWDGICSKSVGPECAVDVGGKAVAVFQVDAPFIVTTLGPGIARLSDGRTCRGECSFVSQAPLQVEAQPDENSAFVSFEGDCTSSDPCTASSGQRITLVFVSVAELRISISGTGRVWEASGRFTCSQSCVQTLRLNRTYSLNFDSPNGLTPAIQGVCTSSSCIVQSGGDLSVRFDEGRRLDLSFSGQGSGQLLWADGGVACSSTSCNFVVGTSEPVSLKALAAAGSAFDGWSQPCGRASNCTIDAGTGGVSLVARFALANELLKSIHVVGAGVGAGVGSMSVAAPEDGGLVVAVQSRRGIEVDGVFLGPSAASTGSFSLLRFDNDGGLQWESTWPSGVDAGFSESAVQQLVAHGGRLVGIGRCGTGMSGCALQDKAVFEFSPATGSIQNRTEFSTMSLGPVDWPWLGGLPLFASYEGFVDVRAGTPVFSQSPFLTAGCSKTVTENLVCVATWQTPWTQGNCSGSRPTARNALGIVELDRNLSCIRVDEFQATVPGNATSTPFSIHSTPAGTAIVVAVTGTWQIGTPISAQTIAVVVPTRGQATTSAVGPHSPGPSVSSQGSIAVTIRTGSSGSAFFGTTVPPRSAALARMALDLSLKDVTVFENADEIVLTPRQSELITVVRGRSVLLDGRPLPGSADEWIHVIRTRD